jgi:hypothetical protein
MTPLQPPQQPKQVEGSGNRPANAENDFRLRTKMDLNSTEDGNDRHEAENRLQIELNGGLFHAVTLTPLRGRAKNSAARWAAAGGIHFSGRSTSHRKTIPR